MSLVCHLGLMQTTRRSKRKGSIDRKLDEELAKSFPVKKPRLVWTEDLHKCFEDAVEKLGLAKAAPKAILEVPLLDSNLSLNLYRK